MHESSDALLHADELAAFSDSVGWTVYTEDPSGPGAGLANSTFVMTARNESGRRDRLPILNYEQLARLTMQLMHIAGSSNRVIVTHHTAQQLSALQPDATVGLLPATGDTLTSDVDAIDESLTAGSAR